MDAAAAEIGRVDRELQVAAGRRHHHLAGRLDRAADIGLQCAELGKLQAHVDRAGAIAAGAGHLEGEAGARHRDLVEPPGTIGLERRAATQLQRFLQQAGWHAVERELVEHALPIDLLAVLAAHRGEFDMAVPAERQVRQLRERREIGQLEGDLAVGRLGRGKVAAAALHIGQRRRGIEPVDRQLAITIQAQLRRDRHRSRRRRLVAQHRQGDVLRAALQRRRNLWLVREPRACRLHVELQRAPFHAAGEIAQRPCFVCGQMGGRVELVGLGVVAARSVELGWADLERALLHHDQAGIIDRRLAVQGRGRA